MENTYSDLFDSVRNATQSTYAQSLLTEIEKNQDDPWNIELFKNILLPEWPQWGKTAFVFLLIAFLLRLLMHTMRRKRIGETVQYVLRCFFTLTVLLQFQFVFEKAALYMRDVLGFLGALLPTFGTLVAASGNVATATTAGAFHSLFLSAVHFALQSILPQVVTFFGGMAVLDAFFGEGRFLKLSSVIKNLLFTSFAFFLAVFFIILRAQNIAASNNDAAAARTLRLLVANAVPIIGGTIGDAMRFAGAGLLQVKNTLGTASVVFLLGMYLPVFLLLFLNSILISFLQFLCDFFAIPGHGEVYTHMKFSMDFLLAVYSAIFAIGMINIGIFMRAGSAFVT